MRRYKIVIAFLLVNTGMTSCRKYVEDVPVQGQRVLVYTEDYRALMNASGDRQEVAFGLAPLMSSDDVDLSAAEIQNNFKTNNIQTAIYTWRKPFYTDLGQDNDWNAMYAAMYTYNVVIDGVMDSKGGDQLLKQTILSEALMHRAFTYFSLVNLYGKQYDAATAETDLGVPLMLKAALFVNLKRASVKQVYEQVMKDIRAAIPILPVKQDINFRPNKPSAYALLSKVYLNMRDFPNAAAFADSTLALSNTLYNYNIAFNGGNFIFPSQFEDKQILLRKVPRVTFSAPQLSQAILDLLGTKDLRYQLFVKQGGSFYPAFTGQGFWSREKYSGPPDKPAVGLSVNETWLIKAECLARAGKKDEAVDMLNTLRKLRFLPADYTDLSAATAADALQLVVNERRREFFGSGLRWFDQRRLNKDAQFAKTVTRVFDGNTYTLAPNSNNYVFPLANILIAQNPEIEQNP
ncbi:RagB/SusD family nutrient uptake outer membrane protein [Chitinophaga sp. 22321]|uniref:RagB/SusD family nutrient uptake outer membrane protein n=1 Tax=Chitinophaga hostae TaxID=2831022 RepID=A0ABS5J9E1_9BACT|nr:RagB/SusD family nutrient uptake outer membrane protein [Chitinophaga hostae]MBS0031831.1 RagB/SusD family nutrient uptake outer membrane protein [Chitinophaga hostae]